MTTMIFGLGGNNGRPTREQLEQEAATIIAERVAQGRPPPEVWRKAEEWRAANPPTGTSWYTPDDADDADAGTVTASPEPPAPTVSPELKARTIRLPARAPAIVCAQRVVKLAKSDQITTP